MPLLLAVDLGLRTGLAAFDDRGRLSWYRSRNFGSRPRLKNAAGSLLKSHPATHLVVEGGGELAPAWERAAHRAGVEWFEMIHAGRWRQDLLLPREQRSGALAKQAADRLARKVIAWSGAPRPTSLRHDAAEAILIGWWGVLRLGWVPDAPGELVLDR